MICQTEYKIEPIGKIENFEYVDEYVKITRLDDDLNLDDAHNW